MKIGGMRSYPKQVFVGDQVWDVVFCKSLAHKRRGHIVGYCDPSDHTISILMGQTPLEMFSTFIHEVMHCFEYEGDFKMPHKWVYKTELWWAKFLIENCLEINNIVFSGEYYRGRGNSFKREPVAVIRSAAAKVRTRVRNKGESS